jgi:RNA polymerase sigma factor (sigma-70 family)
MFSTYATRAIENAIVGAIRSNHAPVLRYPADLQNALRKGWKEWGKLALTNQREPTFEDLYAELVTLVPRESNAREAAEIIAHQTDSVISLDIPMFGRTGDATQISLGDLLPDNSTHPSKWIESMHERQVKTTVEDAITSDILTDQEEQLLRLNLGFGGREPMGHTEIGRKVGLSRGTVTKKIESGLRKLRESGAFTNLVIG